MVRVEIQESRKLGRYYRKPSCSAMADDIVLVLAFIVEVGVMHSVGRVWSNLETLEVR